MKRICAPVATILFLLAASPVASSGTKEELIRLQSDVLALQKQMMVFEKTFADQTQSLKSLVGQLNDQVGESNVILTRISEALQSQTNQGHSSNEILISEIRKLGRQIDETGTRISALAAQVSEINMQTEELQRRRFQSIGNDPVAMALDADTIFHEAYGDLVQGNLDLAIAGFESYVQHFPKSEKADDAQYYIGSVYYTDNRMAEAVAAFTAVLNNYSKGDKAASATFKRAKAELQMGERDNAIADFKSVIKKYPDSSEASLSTNELKSLGVKLTRGRSSRRE